MSTVKNVVVRESSQCLSAWPHTPAMLHAVDRSPMTIATDVRDNFGSLEKIAWKHFTVQTYLLCGYQPVGCNHKPCAVCTPTLEGQLCTRLLYAAEQFVLVKTRGVQYG